MKEFSPRIIAICCNYCGFAAADLAGTMRLKYPPNIRIIRVPCTGKVDALYLLKAFESGADGVMVVGCEEGSCHFMIGNLRAKKRVNYLKGMLERIGFSPQRLEMFNISASMGPQFARTCEEFTEKIKNLGPLMEETSEKREKEVQQVTT